MLQYDKGASFACSKLKSYQISFIQFYTMQNKNASIFYTWKEDSDI